MQPDHVPTPQTAPPPWRLTGSGWVLLYRFPRSFVESHGMLPDEWQGAYQGGIGAVMLVDYQTSPVGGYRELLFTPGVFQRGRRRCHAVTKIYVTSVASMTNGRENWGIPKELAEVELTQSDANTQQFTASDSGGQFFSATLEAGLLRFPVNTAAVPGFMLPGLCQQHADGRWLLTKPHAAGVISPASHLLDIHADGRAFPDVSELTPFGVVQAVSFPMRFPVPRVMDVRQ